MTIRKKGRLRFLNTVITLLVLAMIGRLAYLQIIKYPFYKNKSFKQVSKLITIDPSRGDIYDKDNTPLAISKTAYSIYASPLKISTPNETVNTLAPLINVPKKKLHKKLSKKSHFTWLKRKVSPDLYKQIKAKNLPGIDGLKEEKRVYPNGTLAAHILGFVGIDNQGLGGLEYKYDTRLKGQAGQLRFEGDPRRKQLITSQIRTIKKPQHGLKIITSIDHTLQYLTEKHLAWAIKHQEAESGQAIVMDPHTGDILAMASVPTFNANHWRKKQSKDRRNRCVTDVYEPGSIFKIITLSAVLEEGLYTPDSILKLPETLTLYGKTISEAHERNPEDPDQYTVSEILEKSFNVGTSMLAMELGKDKFHRYITAFGFGDRTGIELPGESKGLLRHPKNWNGLDTAMMSFGQAIGVTPIQMATSLTPIANGGYLVKPRIIHYTQEKNSPILKAVPKVKKHRVISEKTAQIMRQIMTRTVENGTGQIAKIPGYKIGAKTGTAQKAKENGRGYEKGKYISSFAGFFPSDNPQYVILVSIDSPKKHYYGSTVAGPVFRRIVEDIINLKHIAPAKE